jgi:hypothetical protein
MRNRIRLGVSDTIQRRKLDSLLASLGVPCRLVVIDRRMGIARPGH